MYVYVYVLTCIKYLINDFEHGNSLRNSSQRFVSDKKKKKRNSNHKCYPANKDQLKTVSHKFFIIVIVSSQHEY